MNSAEEVYVVHTLMKLSLETDLVADAARDLLAVHAAIGKRHGDQFRALDRRLMALPIDAGKPGLHALEPGLLVATPPQEWLDILAEARRLGLI